jgi:hypothetical protein
VYLRNIRSRSAAFSSHNRMLNLLVFFIFILDSSSKLSTLNFYPVSASETGRCHTNAECIVVSRPPVQHTLSGPAGSQQYHQNQHFSLASVANPISNNRFENSFWRDQSPSISVLLLFRESKSEFGLTPLSVHRFPSRHDLAKKELTKELLTKPLRKEV